MTHQARIDYPGASHHVMNRGIARRPVFMRREEVRYFLAQLARSVRRGELEVDAYCILTTHFHLLVRSPLGQLSRAMMRIENSFVRWFNRRHRRDGSLFRGRYRSQLVETGAYWSAVQAYIDYNPVEAGLVTRPEDYPHGSAWHRSRATCPLWLAPLEHPLEPRDCQRANRVVERRLESGSAASHPLANLIDAAAPEVLAWMRWKTALADGRRHGPCLVDPITLSEIVASMRVQEPNWTVAPVKRQKSGWGVLIDSVTVRA